MVWKTIVIVIALILLPACDDIRGIEICRIDWSEQTGYCAKGDDDIERKLDELDDWFAVSQSDFNKIATKLEECERLGDP